MKELTKGKKNTKTIKQTDKNKNASIFNTENMVERLRVEAHTMLLQSTTVILIVNQTRDINQKINEEEKKHSLSPRHVIVTDDLARKQSVKANALICSFFVLLCFTQAQHTDGADGFFPSLYFFFFTRTPSTHRHTNIHVNQKLTLTNNPEAHVRI